MNGTALHQPVAPLRTLFITHSAVQSGAQRCLNILLEHLDPAQINPVVAVPGEGPVTQWMTEHKIEYHLAPVTWWIAAEKDRVRQLRRCLRGLKERVDRFVTLIRQTKAQLVVSNTSVIIEAALAARICGVPHLWHVLEVLEEDPDLTTTLDMDATLSLIGALSEKVIAVSSIVADSLQRSLSPSKVAIVNTGLDVRPPTVDVAAIRKELGVEPDAFLILYAGLLSIRKGVVPLAQAMASVAQACPKATLLVAGRDIGAKAPMLEALKSGGMDHVQFLGLRNDVYALICASDVVVMPSLSDPLPVSVLEAMHLGRPVVATRSGGCEEMVDDGITGLLVKPGNPKELADALISLAGDKPRREAMGIAAKKRGTEKFSAAAYVASFTHEMRATASLPIDATIGAGVKGIIAGLDSALALPNLIDVCHRAEDHVRSLVRGARVKKMQKA